MFRTIRILTHKFLPAWIYERLIGDWNQDGLRKYFANTSWIALARVITLIVSFFTIAYVARYLGPENYGKLSYAQNFVALFSAFAALGIDQILYRDLVAHPEKETTLLGTAFVARLSFGLLTLIATIATAITIQSDPVLTWMIGIITLSFIFQPFGVISHVFNARVLSKYTAYITIGIAFLIPLLKLGVIFFDKGILYFSSIVATEAAVYALGYIYLYHSVLKHRVLDWRYSSRQLALLLRDSWPLFLASFSGYIYGRIDQVMIQHLIDSTSVGLYDIAVRLTELLGFVPGIIIASLFPAIVNARNRNPLEYKKRFRALAWLCISISFISAATLFFLAPFIITTFFGPDFAGAISLTRLYAWSTIGTVLIILLQQFFIIEHRSRLFLLFSILGAALNVGLNLILIPLYGPAGAAIATIITLCSILVTFWLVKKLLFKNNA